MKTWLLPSIIALLCCIGLLSLRSVAPALVPSQVAYCVLGALVFYTVSHTSFARLQRLSLLGYIVTCALLIVPLLIGKTTRGIAGWIDIGTFFSIQPSQLAMPVIGLFMAEWCATHRLETWSELLKALTLIMIPAVLIVIEPDLGTTIVYLFSLGCMVLLSSVRWQQLCILAGSSLAVMVLSWVLVLEPYQKERITSFIGFSAHQSTPATYNAEQSLIAVGSGQFFGRGLGQGVQSHLRFLPERQTDFIFASLSEELGFVGSILVVSLYWVLMGWCLWLSQQLPEYSAKLYVLGCAALLLMQCTVNIGMNMGLVPITGITLPFISYGGSSLLSMAGMLGIVQSLSQELKPRPFLHLS